MNAPKKLLNITAAVRRNFRQTAAAIHQLRRKSVMNAQVKITPPAETVNQKSILDMPPEVRKNIVGYENLELDEMLWRIICKHAAAVTVDRIIQQLWEVYERTPTRLKVMDRLRSMQREGRVAKLAGTRGSYHALISNPPQTATAAGDASATIGKAIQD